MTYTEAMEILHRMTASINPTHDEFEALNIAIGALKTLEDMTYHKENNHILHESYPMLVTMDYTQDGSRTITNLLYRDYTNSRDYEDTKRYFEQTNDELYAVNFNQNCKEFIEEIVLNSTRLS